MGGFVASGGEVLGCSVGEKVGIYDETLVGRQLGKLELGLNDGTLNGARVGDELGNRVGWFDGIVLGDIDGWVDG